MKRGFSALVFSCVFLLSAVPILAQVQPKTVGEVLFLAVKPGTGADFEAGMKRHMQWHRCRISMATSSPGGTFLRGRKLFVSFADDLPGRRRILVRHGLKNCDRLRSGTESRTYVRKRRILFPA